MPNGTRASDHEMGTESLPAEVAPEGKHGKDSNPQWGFKDVSRFLH